MASRLERAFAYRRSAHFKRLWKFASVSVISTIITQVVLFLTYHEWNIASAMECNVIATAVSTFPAYYLNRTWTWGKTGKSDPWKEVAPFWIISFIGLVLSTVAVGVAAHNADHISHSRDVRALVVQFANLFTYGCIWVARYLVFNKYLFGEGTDRLAGRNAQPVEAVLVANDPSGTGIERSYTSTVGMTTDSSLDTPNRSAPHLTAGQAGSGTGSGVTGADTTAGLNNVSGQMTAGNGFGGTRQSDTRMSGASTELTGRGDVRGLGGPAPGRGPGPGPGQNGPAGIPG